MNKRYTDVEFLAKLARLDLGSAETNDFPKQIPAILDYVGQLRKVSVDRLAPVIPARKPLRADETAVSRAVQRILAEAPERDGQFWQVKSVF